MNSCFRLVYVVIISLFLISCWGKKKNPDPDENSTNIDTMVSNLSNQIPAEHFYKLEKYMEDILRQNEDILRYIAQLQAKVTESDYRFPASNNTEKLKKLAASLDTETMYTDSSNYLPTDQFYELGESVKDALKQIEHLQTQVVEYQFQQSKTTNYTEKLKELIDEFSPVHIITLKNGSIIEGTIENDMVENIMVKTDVGKLTINKTEIENIEDLLLPIPEIIFIGHGQEEIFDNYHLFTGKVLNQGGHRGDFVRVIYQLWGADTQIISSDSSFVAGTQVIYNSGIVTDTALEPNQAGHFSVMVPISSKIPVSYVTREVHWLLYD